MFTTTHKYIDTSAKTRRTPLVAYENPKIKIINASGKRIKDKTIEQQKQAQQRIKSKIPPFFGWGPKLSKNIKALQKIKGEDLEKKSMIQTINLNTDDLTEFVRSRIQLCILAVSYNSRNGEARNSGWCERSPAPVKIRVNNDIKTYCNRGEVGMDWMKIILSDNSNTQYTVASFLMKSSIQKELFQQKLQTLTIHELTYWFAENVGGFALLKTPYAIEMHNQTVLNSVYIILTCTSQQFTFMDDGTEKRAVVLAPVLFNAISQFAKDLAYPLVSLRAADVDLINVYYNMKFRRSLNATDIDLNHDPEGDTSTTTIYPCDGHGEPLSREIHIKGKLKALPIVDQNVADDGYFMTRAV